MASATSLSLKQLIKAAFPLESTTSMTPEKLAENWRRHAAKLLVIARSIGEPAEDAVQEAFLQLARQEPPPQDTFAWLVRVTRNQILQWQRSLWRRRRREVQRSPAIWFSEAHLETERSLDAEGVTAALANLDPDQRQIIVMRLWGELSFNEIASVIGCSQSTAHRTYQTAIRTMRSKFNPHPTQASKSQPS